MACGLLLAFLLVFPKPVGVCGYQLPTEIPSNCWYAMITSGTQQDNKKPAMLVNMRVLRLLDAI
jgi:hypothetical protein